MPILQVADVSIQYRDMTVPDTCPKCGVSFLASEKSNLRHVQYVQEAEVGRLVAVEVLTTFGKPTPVMFEASDRSCCDTFVTVGYYCASCAYALAEGKEEVSEA